jgi:hypothetical protein
LPLALDRDVPAASLHFIDFDDRAIGVLHLRDGDYLTWPITKLAASFGAFIQNILLKNFGKEVSDAALIETGYALYNLLLPPGDPDAMKARGKIEDLTTARLNMSGDPVDAPPIMVRIAPRHIEDAFFVPLAMLAVPVGAQKHFLGDSFRVHTPLAFQSDQPEQSCISRWAMVMPPLKDQSLEELVNARKEFTQWTDACKGADCLDSIPKFEDWIGMQTPEKQSTALLLLAHYEDDSFSFDHTEFASPGAIAKPFESPSVAIIDACGTGSG